MAASAWTVFFRAKHNLGKGVIDIDGSQNIKAVLFRASLSTMLSATIDVSTFASLGSLTCTAGGGDEVATLGTITWTGAASAKDTTRTWDASDIIFTASTQAISSIRYCVLYQSTSAGGGPLICQAALSTGSFPLATNNVLTVQLAAGGIFTLA